MKFYQKRGFALIVLILAIIGAGVWGISHKPDTDSYHHAELLDVKYQQWIKDEAGVLSNKTEKTVADYNSNWDSRYYALVAVASVKSISGWEMEDYAVALGTKWGLGANDMLLLLVTGSDETNWYVACGDNVLDAMSDTQQYQLRQAIESAFFNGKYDEAVTAFYRQADVFYGQTYLGNSGGSWDGSQDYYDYYPQQQRRESGINITGVILLLIAFFVVWIILDRMRYNRYRRRYMGPTVVTPVVTYYPIFWGRAARPVPPAAPRPPHSPSGGYAAPRPARPAQTRPSGTPQRPVTTNRPRGFGGNSRGGSSMSRSGGMSSGGGMSRGGGNSRGGFGGGGFGGKHR